MNPGCHLDVSYDVHYYYTSGNSKTLVFLIVNDFILIFTLSVEYATINPVQLYVEQTIDDP